MFCDPENGYFMPAGRNRLDLNLSQCYINQLDSCSDTQQIHEHCVLDQNRVNLRKLTVLTEDFGERAIILVPNIFVFYHCCPESRTRHNTSIFGGYGK